MAIPFGKVPVALALDPNISSEAVRVYAILRGKHANRSGQCYPSLKLLAGEMCCSVRSVINFVAELRAAGWISRAYKSGKHGANLYTVNDTAQCKILHSAKSCTVQNPAQDSAAPCTVNQAALEPDPFPSPGEPDPLNQTHSTLQRKAETEVTPDFVEAMVSEFSAKLGGEQRTREVIELALNHKAMDRAKSKRIYLRGWLRRDAESYVARGGQNGRGNQLARTTAGQPAKDGKWHPDPATAAIIAHHRERKERLERERLSQPQQGGDAGSGDSSGGCPVPPSQPQPGLPIVAQPWP